MEQMSVLTAQVPGEKRLSAKVSEAHTGAGASGLQKYFFSWPRRALVSIPASCTDLLSSDYSVSFQIHSELGISMSCA